MDLMKKLDRIESMQNSGAFNPFSGGSHIGAPSWNSTEPTGAVVSRALSSPNSGSGSSSHAQNSTAGRQSSQDVGASNYSLDTIGIDARKRELLEARFIDKCFQQGHVQEAPQYGQQYGQQSDSNLSGGSQHSNGNGEDQAGRLPPHAGALPVAPATDQTPEKSRTPSGGERKRKRKQPVEQNDNSGPGKSSRLLDGNPKKISEYFKYQAGSPGRGRGKPPSPQGPCGFPPSPQQVYGNSTSCTGNQLDVPTSPSQPGILRPTAPPSGVHKQIQTELTCLQLQTMEAKSVSDLSKRDGAITELERANEELRRQLTAQQKLLDKHKETINKCSNMTKMLLVEKSNLKKKKVPTATLR